MHPLPSASSDVAHTLLNDTFLRALLRQPTDYTPIWLMRQAGRYLPEYNATRARAGSFLGLAKNPDYATEVTLQPLERYPLDAAILFSDILTDPRRDGPRPEFRAGRRSAIRAHGAHGRRTSRASRCRTSTRRCATSPTPSAQIRRALTDAQGRQKVPLIGFSGSPWTLACYMVEGGGSDDHPHGQVDGCTRGRT